MICTTLTYQLISLTQGAAGLIVASLLYRLLVKRYGRLNDHVIISIKLFIFGMFLFALNQLYLVAVPGSSPQLWMKISLAVITLSGYFGIKALRTLRP